MERVGFALVSLFVCALALGGGGSAYGLQNLVVQLVALALLLAFPDRAYAFVKNSSRVTLGLLAMTFALPVLQLVPLPPEVWRALPGRELVVESRDVVGAGGGWYPITLARHATVTASLSLLGPLAVLVLYLGRNRSTAKGGLYLLVLLGLANFLLGAVQVIGGGSLSIYPAVTEGRLHGFFANHNTSGLFFVISLCSAIALLSLERLAKWERVGLAGVAVLYVIGVLLTNSRSSTALLLLPIGFSAYVLRHRLKKMRPKRMWVALAAGLMAFAAIGGMLVSSGRVAGTIERFETLEDARPQIWEDTLSGVERYWPMGSGIGTFDEVFQVEESLENLLSLKAGRAHSDYLEIVLEAGVFGVLLIVAWICFVAVCCWQSRKSPDRYVALGASLGLLAISLQSTLDYPLRNQMLLCVAALLLGMLLACLNSVEDKVIE